MISRQVVQVGVGKARRELRGARSTSSSVSEVELYANEVDEDAIPENSDEFNAEEIEAVKALPTPCASEQGGCRRALVDPLAIPQLVSKVREWTRP